MYFWVNFSFRFKRRVNPLVICRYEQSNIFEDNKSTDTHWINVVRLPGGRRLIVHDLALNTCDRYERIVGTQAQVLALDCQTGAALQRSACGTYLWYSQQNLKKKSYHMCRNQLSRYSRNVLLLFKLNDCKLGLNLNATQASQHWRWTTIETVVFISPNT